MIDLSFDVWKNILLALAVAFVISFAATPVVSSFAKKVGAIDIPDKKRHIHSHPIPRMGGLAIFLGFLLSVLLFANITPQVRGILLGAILIVVVGAIDDVMNLNAWLKFCVQIVAAVIAVLSGVIINVVSNPLLITSEQAVTIGILAVPVTILWIVGVTNSVNLIDGLDGLACGVSAIASLTMLVVSLLVSDANINVAVILAALCGGCLGFIPYNLNPAKIFMGDTCACACRSAFGHDICVYTPHPARTKPLPCRQGTLPPQAAGHGPEPKAGRCRALRRFGHPRPCRGAADLDRNHPRRRCRHCLCHCRVHMAVRVQKQQQYPSAAARKTGG